jgi:hypothetical protein
MAWTTTGTDGEMFGGDDHAPQRVSQQRRAESVVIVVDRVQCVEEHDRLLLGERDPLLVGEDLGRSVGRCSPEEVAQRFADRRGGGLVDRAFLVGESKFESLSTHRKLCTDIVREVKDGSPLYALRGSCPQSCPQIERKSGDLRHLPQSCRPTVLSRRGGDGFHACCR